MSCRHAKGNVCLILNNNGKCGIFNQDEERCSKQQGAIIWYLKTIGTYDEKVKNNPDYLAEKPQVSKHKSFIMDRFTKKN